MDGRVAVDRVNQFFSTRAWMRGAVWALVLAGCGPDMTPPDGASPRLADLPSRDLAVTTDGLKPDGAPAGGPTPDAAPSDGPTLDGAPLDLASDLGVADGAAPDMPIPRPPFIQEPPRNPSFGADVRSNPGSVLLHSGELVLARTDLAIRGRRIGVAFTRTYRSGNDRQGPLGFGWDANVFIRLEAQMDGSVLLHDGSGRTDRFTVGMDGFGTALGRYERLRSTANGRQLRDRSGTIRTFDPGGRLLTVEDRIGNRHEYRYTMARLTSLLDELGREVTFAYDNQGHLTSLKDFTGREVKLTYDGAGDLVEARSPLITQTPHGNDFPGGRREQYRYQGKAADPRLEHNLVAVVAPAEVADGSNTFSLQTTDDAAGDLLDRVVSQTVGGKNGSGVTSGGTLTFAYDFLAMGGPMGATAKTTVTDRRGHSTEYWHDAQGHCLRGTEDAAGGRFTTEAAYNADGERVSATQPMGNRIAFTFDDKSADRFQQGNLLAAVRTPDGMRGGAPKQIEERFTWEPLYNQPRTRVSPPGLDAGHAPPNGRANSAARYTTTFTYDYQEAAQAPKLAATWGIAIPQPLLSLGDRNGDGRTDQAMGNLVRVDHPTVQLVMGSQQAKAAGSDRQAIVDRYRFDSFGQLTAHLDAPGNRHTLAYHPEADPDGDGKDLTMGRDGKSGGYLAEQVVDATAGPERKELAPPAMVRTRFAYDRLGRLTARTDGRGLVHRQSWNAVGELLESEAPTVDPGQARGYLRRFRYDANGNPVAREVQNVTTNAARKPEVVVAYEWFKDTRVFDIENRLVEQQVDAKRDPAIPASMLPEKIVTRHERDPNGNPVKTPRPAGQVVARSYDPRNLLIAVTRDPQGINSKVTFTRDRNGNLVKTTDAADNDATPGPESMTYDFDGFDRVTAVTDRAGNVTRSSYDAEGQVVAREHLGPATVGGANVSLARQTFAHDEMGRTYQLDEAAFVPQGVTPGKMVTLAEGVLTPGDGRLTHRLERDELGRISFRVEDHGAVWAMQYDGAGRLVRSISPLVDKTGKAQDDVMVYDGNGNLARRTATHVSPEGLNPPAALTSIYVYDNLDRPVRATDPLGHTRYRDYDSRDLLVTDYDERGEPGLADPVGLFNGKINGPGNPRRFYRDGVGRAWMEVRELHQGGQGQQPLDLGNAKNRDGKITLRTEYDAASRVVRRIDDLGNVQQYEYDLLDRPTRQVNADRGERLVKKYDADGHALEIADENGTTHTLSWDGLGRLREHRLGGNPGQIKGTNVPMLVGTTLQRFAYDGRSRLISAFDDNEPMDMADDWTVTMAYDSLGRPIDERQNGVAVGWSYEAGRREALHYPGTARLVHYRHDAANQLVSVSNSANFTVVKACQGSCCCDPIRTTFRAPPPGQMMLREVGSVRRTLDMDKRPVTVELWNGTGERLVQNPVHTRNASHQVASTTRQYLSFQRPPLTHRTNSQLDSAGRLVGDTLQRSNDPLAPTERLAIPTLDGAGALQSLSVREDVAQGPMVTSYPRNEVLEPTGQYQSGQSPSTGIRTADPRFHYQWDRLNRLRVVRDRANPAKVIARYRYDAHPAISGGRRVEKQVTAGGPGDGTTRYYYDGDRAIEERLVAMGKERVSRQFIFGNLADEVLAMHVDTNADGDPDKLYFYGHDFNNNVVALLDGGTGAAAEYYTYAAFQRPILRHPSTFAALPASVPGNPHLFTGQPYDAETGLYYYKARYYDPELGEFISRDPIGIWGDRNNTGHGMGYVGGDFWNRADPTGLGYQIVPGQIGGRDGYRVYDSDGNFRGNYYPSSDEFKFYLGGQWHDMNGAFPDRIAATEGGLPQLPQAPPVERTAIEWVADQVIAGVSTGVNAYAGLGRTAVTAITGADLGPPIEEDATFKYLRGIDAITIDVGGSFAPGFVGAGGGVFLAFDLKTQEIGGFYYAQESICTPGLEAHGLVGWARNCENLDALAGPAVACSAATSPVAGGVGLSVCHADSIGSDTTVTEAGYGLGSGGISPLSFQAVKRWF